MFTDVSTCLVGIHNMSYDYELRQWEREREKQKCILSKTVFSCRQKQLIIFKFSMTLSLCLLRSLYNTPFVSLCLHKIVIISLPTNTHIDSECTVLCVALHTHRSSTTINSNCSFRQLNVICRAIDNNFFMCRIVFAASARERDAFAQRILFAITLGAIKSV